MKINGERYLPPGMSYKVQGMTLRIGLMVSFAYSLRFLDTYWEHSRSYIGSSSWFDGYHFTNIPGNLLWGDTRKLYSMTDRAEREEKRYD